MEKSKKLTKLQALELCKELWLWLAKHTDKGKKAAPVFDRFEYEIEHRCFMCEYVKRKLNTINVPSATNCKHCLILSVWGAHKDSHCPCETGEDSPWPNWKFTIGEGKKRQCMRIVDACEVAIKKLKGGDKVAKQKGKVPVGIRKKPKVKKGKK